MNFIELAASGTLREIRRVFESEDFGPVPPGTVEEQGERRTLAARYDASIDASDEEQSARLIRAYLDGIASWGRTGEGQLNTAARALVVSLQNDGVAIDDEGNRLLGRGWPSKPHRRAETDDRNRLFVSHAAVDVDLAEAVIELLRLGTDLRGSDIFLSSLPETGVPPGRDFLNYIRDELTGAALVLQLITPAFFESSFCLCELGAQWGMELPCYPLLVRPIDYGDLHGVLGHVQAAKIDDPAGLDGLYDRVREDFDLDPPTAQWTKQRGRFLSRLDELLAELAQPQKVELQVFQQAQTQLESARDERDRARKEVEGLTRKVQVLAKAKDADEVAEILADEDLENDFDRLVDEARDLLRPLPSIVLEALFHRIAGSVFVPQVHDYEDVDREVANGFLERSEWEEQRVELNDRDPAIRRALTVLRQLSAFSPDRSLEMKFEREHDIAFDFANRRMWEELGFFGGWLRRGCG